MADSPFYQPARQNFSSSQSMQQPQGGFGGFGGGQMPQQNWGGGQGFSGFGGGQGFNFGGGQAFGGFQQQQFNPFQGGFGGGFSPFQGGFGGGFGGGFQPQGFGGFNPMFGGIGGLGFNPMMGPQFGMPMQGFGGFDPYQQQDVARRQDQMPRMASPTSPLSETDWSAQNAARAASGMQFRPQSYDDYLKGFKTPEQTQDAIRQRQIQSGLTPLQPPQSPVENPFEEQQRQFRSQVDALPEYQALQNAQRALEGSDAFKSIQQKQYDLTRQMDAERMQARPMYGGLGSLGFNPMMGPQFGMPMKQVQRSQYENPQQRQVAEAEKARWASLTPEQRSDENNALRARFQQEYSPIMGLQFGMPMGQRAQLLQDQRQFNYGQDVPQMQPKEDLSFEAFKASQPKSDPNKWTPFNDMTMMRPSQEQQYRSWLNSKITPNTNRQLMPGESPRQNISQSDVDSVYNRYLESSRPNTQMSAQLAAAQAAQMRAVMGI